MDKVASRKIVREALKNSFSKERFVYFIKTLLNTFDEASFVYKGNFIPDAYEKHISTLERVGKYSDGEHRIDILIVTLKKDTSIERARTMQRNFIAWYLNGSRGGELKDAALVAFVSPNEEDWRFSLVKMDYRFTEGKNGKTKVKEEFTPARRWSFLVGKNENSYTAQSCLAPVVADDERNPTLKQLEEAFNIEPVTKEFFEKYRELFLRFNETLEDMVKKDLATKKDFIEKNVVPVDFSKKTLGQIIFLYFLQKKGWFGVPMNKTWGEGDKNFLRTRFAEAQSKGKNYFNDYLEPLFYEALARERDKDFYSRFDCKIPFLNGGLFDPIKNYDWVNTSIDIPNDIFSNQRKTKDGDVGDGILDTFDRYNFTVKEDEPLEKEVAVDPEMLGRVFENLLEIKDRKSKGTYYTPREIVHYMCQESLVNYLTTELEKTVGKEDIEKLIKYGEVVVENESHVVRANKETATYSFKLPESIRKNAELIDEKLTNIRICDPAVGSGAFPVGMMNEIVRTRNALTPYLASDEEWTAYDFKRHAIQNCLYGVDIDPGAVEIAKLRLWLSLIVDEEDFKRIKTLPNLDYKIMQGNSLLENYKGISFYSDYAPGSLFEKNDLDLRRLQLVKKKQEYFNENNPSRKRELRSEIQSILSGFVSGAILEKQKTIGKNTFKKIYGIEADDLIKNIQNADTEKPFFLWKLNFIEVFREKGGFDVVLANPPYFQLQKNSRVSQELSEQGYKTYSKSSDIYCVFYEKGVNLLKDKGTLSYISSDSWMKTKYGALLRKYLKENTNPLILIDFENSRVFDTAIVESNVIVLEKDKFKNELKALNFNFDPDRHEDIDSYFKNNCATLNNLDDSGWIISSAKISLLRKKIEKDSTRLKQLDQHIYIGILNGYNDAFVIDSDTKNKLTKEDPKSAEIIKPMLRGRDVGKYYYEWQGLWFINSHNGLRGKLPRIDVEKNYPAIYRHLAQYRKKLEIRHNKGSHWTNLRNCAYFPEFEKPKIIWGELSDEPKFAYDENRYYSNQTNFILTGKNLKYLLGILNSRLAKWYFEQLSTSSGMGTSRWLKYKIELFPIKNTDNAGMEKIVNIVNKILAITESDDYLKNQAEQVRVSDYEKQIDQLVYQLYGLTKEEITILEESQK